MLEKEKKDKLYLGLAREPRYLLIPVNIFKYLVGIGIILLILFVSIGKIYLGIFIFLCVYLFFVSVTYEEDNGLSYFMFKLKRMLFNSKKAFDGYSYGNSKSFLQGLHSKTIKLAKGEKMESKKIPFKKHITPEIVQLEDGNLLSLIKLDGFHYDTQDYETLNNLKNHRNNAFRQLGSKYALQIHYIRKKIEEDELKLIDNIPIYNYFQKEYGNSLNENKLFKNDIYISIIYRKINPNDLFFNRWRSILKNKNLTSPLMIKEFKDDTAILINELKTANPRLLSIKKEGNKEYSELINLFSYILNLDDFKIPYIKDENINEYISVNRKIFKTDGTIYCNCLDGTNKAAAIFSIQNHNYPDETDHQMLDSFLEINHELIISESFLPIDKRSSISLSKTRKSQFKIVEDVAISQVKEIDDALDSIASSQAVNGIFNFNILVIATNLQDYKDACSKVRDAFGNINIIPKKEDLLAEPSFYSLLSGNFELIQRPVTISSLNFAGFASLHNSKIGKKYGNHWGEYIIALKSKTHSKYYFNWHENDIGHTEISAPTGLGKSVILNAFTLASLKHNPYIFHFDFEFSAGVFMESIGANHIILSTEINTGWNPLFLDDTEINRSFLFRLLSYMGQAFNDQGQKIELTAQEEMIINKVIDRIFTYKKELRVLRNFISYFGTPDGNNLATRMQRWVNNGRLAKIFDNPTDVFSLKDARRFCFEMKNIMTDNEALFAMTMYIFHRIDLAMDGNVPFMVILDEGQRFIKDKNNLKFLENMLETFRKRNGMVVFVAPTSEILINNPIFRQQFKTGIFLPNPKASEQTFLGANGLGFSNREYNWLITTDASKRELLIKNSYESLITRLDLSSLPSIIDVLSGNEFKYNILQNILKNEKIEAINYDKWIHPFSKKIRGYKNEKIKVS